MLFDEVNGMLEDENLVTHDHSHQRDDTHDRGESEGAPHQSQANQCTRHHQSQGGDADQADAILLEVEQQEEENDDLGDSHAAEYLRQCLSIVFYLATDFRTDALRDVYLMLHDVGHARLYRSGIDAVGKLCRHSDTALASAMHDTALAPLGSDTGNGTKRNSAVRSPGSSGKHGHRRGNTQVLDVGVGHVGIVLDDNGQFVVTFPDLSYAQVVGGGTQSEGCCSTGDAKLCRGYGIELDIDQWEGLQEVGVYPLQFGHLTHAFHQPFGCDME